jgi:sporulation protein YlmC with PRC-barrel domain
MHGRVRVLTVSAAALALAATASAQTSTTKDAPTRTQRPAWAASATAVEAKQIIGMKVKNDQGKDVGEIDQLILEPGDGKITHVVVGRGGVLGVGEQKVVLLWTDVKMQPDSANRNRWVAMIDQAKLDTAPRYEVRRDTTPAASPSTAPSSTTPRQDRVKP